jgi:hypothetical protein
MAVLLKERIAVGDLWGIIPDSAILGVLILGVLITFYYATL